jgi:DNA (cytosine-5)-methyltransferase 1
VFFVASIGEVEPQSVLFADDVRPPNNPTRLDTHAHGFYWTEGTRGLGWAPDAIPTLKNGSTIGIPSPPAILLPTGDIVKPDVRDAERLQGFPADWTAVAPERQRWSLIGNAVTVPIARWLGHRLQMPGFYDQERDREWVRSSGAFPRAARYDGKRRYIVDIGDFPVWIARSPLDRFLDYPGVPLSVRATSGFLSRAEASSLRFMPGFLNAVRGHLLRMELSMRSKEMTAAKNSKPVTSVSVN